MIKIEDKIQNFRNALRNHDWFFDFSDDHSVWCRGRDERDSLFAIAKSLVRNDEMSSIEVASIWNEFAPTRFGAEPSRFEPIAPTPKKVLVKGLNRPRMNEVIAFKNEHGCSASEANFRLRFGVEPSELERELAESNGGKFILHFPSHPELWEWSHDIA
jgi:hypothetical protein